MDRLRAFLFILITLIIAQPLHAKGNPRINAQAAVLMDAGSGKVLYAKNAFYAMFPASTTKIMTAVLALELGKLNAKVPISIHALNGHEHSQETWTLQPLLLVCSCLPAMMPQQPSVVYISGSETRFALNDREAWALGDEDNRLKTPAVFPRGHYTCFDLACFRYHEEALFRKIVKTKRSPKRSPAAK